MVDVKFVAPARHFVPLALLRHIADDPSPSPPQSLHYIGDAGIKAIKGSHTALSRSHVIHAFCFSRYAACQTREVECPESPRRGMANGAVVGGKWRLGGVSTAEDENQEAK